jgi:hypothetical protein
MKIKKHNGGWSYEIGTGPSKVTGWHCDKAAAEKIARDYEARRLSGGLFGDVAKMVREQSERVRLMNKRLYG